MPVTFKVDTVSGAVLTTARGIVSYAELLDHINAKLERGLITRAELFDARDINLDLSLSELQGIADQTKRALGARTPGKIAVVTNSAFVYGLARAYAVISREDNPRFQVFQDAHDAHAWVVSEKDDDTGSLEVEH